MSNEEKPPYVTFETTAVEKRLEGKLTFVDVDYAYITRPGGKDTYVDEVSNWLHKVELQAEAGRIPENWPRLFREKYNAWKKGEELPATGTPLKISPLFSPAEAKAILAVGVKTVEDLADLNEEGLRSIGMGAVVWRDKARAWLAQRDSKVDLAEALATLQRDVAALKEQNTTLLAENKQLSARLQPATI